MILRNRVSRRLRREAARLLGKPEHSPPDDPTLQPPPGYTLERADAVYGEALRRCFEYLAGTGVKGNVLEFGTFRGYTARRMACLIRDLQLDGMLHLFDSFEGLPEIDSPIDQRSYEVSANQAWFPGQMASHQGMAERVRAGIARVLPESRFKVTKGYFEDTLDANLPAGKAALIHIDCDLYSSTKQVLDRIFSRDLLQDGCLIVCDDYNCNRASPLMGERLALSQAFEGERRYQYSPWFSYGWHGQVFFVHDMEPSALSSPAVAAGNNGR
jgi:hypothetical protein